MFKVQESWIFSTRLYSVLTSKSLTLALKMTDLAERTEKSYRVRLCFPSSIGPFNKTFVITALIAAKHNIREPAKIILFVNFYERLNKIFVDNIVSSVVTKNILRKNFRHCPENDNRGLIWEMPIFIIIVYFIDFCRNFMVLNKIDSELE